jgi:hypothetical protein
LRDSARRIAGARHTFSSSRGGHRSRSFGRKYKEVSGQESKVKMQKTNVKSDGILPLDPALRDDLHFDLPFDVS